VAEDVREGARSGVARAESDESPALDPDAVRRSYHHHRARRRARVEHSRRTKRAGARFWVVFVLLVVAFVLLALTTWREIGRLFGL
jgi:hypothetical protein